MRTIALCQCYNESLFIQKNILNVYNYVDEIVISEGCLSPFGNLPQSSSDNTCDKIIDLMDNQDPQNKIKYVTAYATDKPIGNREQWEGLNKNKMLEASSIEHGDTILILDADEFFSPSSLCNIPELFRKHNKIRHVRCEEYQFAYNLKLQFKASHGRWMRYVDGAKFGNTNHFFWPDKQDITKRPDIFTNRDDFPFFHLCWAKHPILIREKVLSFNRPSFISWFNMVYLEYPFCSDLAYKNNSIIHPYYGVGYAEGQSQKLYEYNGVLPETLSDLEIDWMPYIIEHKKELLI